MQVSACRNTSGLSKITPLKFSEFENHQLAITITEPTRLFHQLHKLHVKPLFNPLTRLIYRSFKIRNFLIELLGKIGAILLDIFEHRV